MQVGYRTIIDILLLLYIQVCVSARICVIYNERLNKQARFGYLLPGRIDEADLLLKEPVIVCRYNVYLSSGVDELGDELDD